MKLDVHKIAWHVSYIVPMLVVSGGILFVWALCGYLVLEEPSALSESLAPRTPWYKSRRGVGLGTGWGRPERGFPI